MRAWTDLSAIPMPDRVARLGRDVRGYPIPFFALIQDGGAVDFAVVDTVKWSAAMKGRRCGVCGEPLGVRVAS